MAKHSLLTGASLHEPKGVASAASGTVYIANGSGSGVWTALVNQDTINNKNKIYLNLHYNDLDTTNPSYVVCPLAGTVTKIWCVIDQAIATANTILTPSIGGVNITNGAITIAFSGSAAGDINIATPTANNTVAAGQAIKFVSDGATNTANAHAQITIEITV